MRVVAPSREFVLTLVLLGEIPISRRRRKKKVTNTKIDAPIIIFPPLPDYSNTKNRMTTDVKHVFIASFALH